MPRVKMMLSHHIVGDLSQDHLTMDSKYGRKERGGMAAMTRSDRHVRQAAVAGYFYPQHAGALREEIEGAFCSPLGPGTLPEVNPSGPRRLIGVIVPHAGYPYSAQGAAWSYAEVARDGRPGLAVLLGVNHGHGAPLALSPDEAWTTPLGCLPVAAELGQRLRELEPEVTLDARAHCREHSIEVQVPFLQYLFGELPFLPILVGHASVDAVLRLGQALAELAKEQDLLIIASTDFSHYVSQETAQRLDQLALDAIATVHPAALIDTVRRQDISMCGVLPVAALLAAAQALGAQSASILHYHTSGDVTGDRQAVVGYGAMAIYR
jgi:hypothetical protein